MPRPSIHSNGTSRDALLDSYISAGQALQDAIRAFSDAAPNARDYYVQGPDAYRLAAQEFEAHQKALRAALIYLRDLAEHVSE